MTAKPKKQKPTKQKFVVEVVVETIDLGATKPWTKKQVRELLANILRSSEAVIFRVRKVDLD